MIVSQAVSIIHSMWLFLQVPAPATASASIETSISSSPFPSLTFKSWRNKSPRLSQSITNHIRLSWVLIPSSLLRTWYRPVRWGWNLKAFLQPAKFPSDSLIKLERIITFHLFWRSKIQMWPYLTEWMSGWEECVLSLAREDVSTIIQAVKKQYKYFSVHNLLNHTTFWRLNLFPMKNFWPVLFLAKIFIYLMLLLPNADNRSLTRAATILAHFSAWQA